MILMISDSGNSYSQLWSCSEEFIYGFTQRNKNNFSQLKIKCKKTKRTLWKRVGYVTQRLCLNHRAEGWFFFPISWIFLCLLLNTRWLSLLLSGAGWVTALCCWSQATRLHPQLSQLHGFKRAVRSLSQFPTASMSSDVIHEHKVNTAQ